MKKTTNIVLGFRIAVTLTLSAVLGACSSGGSAENNGMALEGMFRYMADAALFQDCRTDRSFPVAMESGYLELERAYLNSGIEAGRPAWVSVRGRYLERPAMEGNHNKVKLIVDSFNSISLDKSCTPEPLVELVNTYWKLQIIDGRKVAVSDTSQREAHFILKQEDGSLRVQGNSSCNNFFGEALLDPGQPGTDQQSSLSFNSMGMTMKACPQGMDTERAFLSALGNTHNYRIRGMFLELLGEQEDVLARFEAIHF